MVFPLRVQDCLMKPSQVLLAHSVCVSAEAGGLCLCHTHAHSPAFSSHRYANTCHMVWVRVFRIGWIRPQPFLLISVLWVGTCLCLHPAGSAVVLLFTGKYGGGDGSPGPVMCLYIYLTSVWLPLIGSTEQVLLGVFFFLVVVDWFFSQW